LYDSFIWAVQNRQTHRDREQVSGCQVMWGGEEGGVTYCNGYEELFWGDEQAWKLQKSGGCTTL